MMTLNRCNWQRERSVILEVEEPKPAAVAVRASKRSQEEGVPPPLTLSKRTVPNVCLSRPE